MNQYIYLCQWIQTKETNNIMCEKYSYKIIEREEVHNLTINNRESYSIEDIPDFIGDEYFDVWGDPKALLQDIFDKYLENMSCWNKIQSSGFTECIDWSEAYDAIRKDFVNKLFIIYNEEDNTIEAIFPAGEALVYLLEEKYPDAEPNEIITCELWTAQLQNFIDKAEWHVALTDGDNIISDIAKWPSPTMENNGNIKWLKKNISSEETEFHPLIWFGISSDAPDDDYWVLTKDGMKAFVKEEDGMGSYGSQLHIEGLEINYIMLYDMTDWYFGDCGNSGADYEKVVNTCPVNLHNVYFHSDDNEKVITNCLLNIQEKYQSHHAGD